MLRRLYDWILTKAGDPRATLWLAFFAFADGGLFPFPPHPLLALMCLAQPKQAVRFALIASFASVAGGVLGYLIGHFLYAAIGTPMLSALGLTASFPRAACYLRAYGAEIILVKGLTPIPFLLLSITAGFIALPLPLFIAATFISRVVIFLGIGTLFRIFGPAIKLFLDKYLTAIAAAALVVLVSGYTAVAMLGGSAKTTSDKCASAGPIAKPAQPSH